jgi:hypothetical protein
MKAVYEHLSSKQMRFSYSFILNYVYETDYEFSPDFICIPLFI